MIDFTFHNPPSLSSLGVVPVLVGPLQVLLAILPGLLLALAGALMSMFRPRAMLTGVRLLWRLKAPVALIVLCLAGATWAARSLWPHRGAGAGVGAAEASARDWQVFGGGLARTGAVPGALGPTAASMNWAWRRDSESFFASPAVVGNRVYIASATLSAFDQSGRIYCFDADSGAVVWQAAPPRFRPTFSSPAVSGRYLVCGEGLHNTRDARIVCLDLTPGSEGKVLWTHRTHSHVECTPVIEGERVYVGAGDDGYYCFDLAPDERGEARVVWHVPTEKYPDAETSLAVHDGKVYAGLGNGGRALCVLNADTGQELRRIDTPFPVFGPPAIADGKLYIGMGNGDYVHTAEEARAVALDRMRDEGKSEADVEAASKSLGPAGQVWCIDLATFSVDWKFQVDRTVLGAVAVTDDALYFGCRDGYLYAVSQAGQLIGRWNAHAPIIASPAVTDRHVYFVTNAGTLYGLDRRTLEPLWEMGLGTKPLFISSPAVARGRIYIGTQADGFLCVGQVRSEQSTPLWPGHLAGPGAAGNPDIASTAWPQFGAFHWQFPADQQGETTNAVVTAPVAVSDRKVYVSMAAGPLRGLVCLPADAPANTPADKAPPPRWHYATANGVTVSPAVVGDNVFIVDGRAGDGDRALHCVAAGDGQLRWRFAVGSGASGVFIASRKQLFIQDTDGGLSCVDLSGKKLWTQPTGAMGHAPAVTPSMLVAVTAPAGGAAASSPKAALVALDRMTGRTLWRVELDAVPVASPFVHDGTIYLATVAGIESRRLVDGGTTPGWTLTGGGAATGSGGEGGGATGDFAVTRDAIVYVNRAGELIVLSRDDGAVQRRVPGALLGGGISVNPLVGRDAVIYAAKDSFMRLDLSRTDSEPARWLDTSWLGAPCSPMVVAGKDVYVGVPGWGLVRMGAAP